MRTRLLSDDEYGIVLNAKSYNPMRGPRTPEHEEAFSDEFWDALKCVEQFSEERWSRVSPEDTPAFHIYPAHNFTRVIGVEFSHDLFLREQDVRALQGLLRNLPEKWLVELSCANTLFVTPDEVLAHLPVADMVQGVSLRWLEDFADPAVALPIDQTGAA